MNAEAASNPRPSPAPGLRRNGNWRWLWLSQAVSLTGDSVFEITVMLWVAAVIAKGQTWAPTAASGVLVAAAVPILVVGPLAGVWVDRLDRRRIMLAADAGRAILIASLIAVPLLGRQLPADEALAIIYVVVAAESSLAQFFNPSRLALIGLIMPSEDRPQASGLLQATNSTATIIGPPLAAPMLFAAGPQWALIVDAISFGLSFAAITRVRIFPSYRRPQTSHRSGFRAEFRAGAQFFVASRVLVALSIGVIICTLGTGALNALDVFFLRDNLHAAPRWLGTLYAAIGLGAVGGALVSGRVARVIGAARTFWLATVLGGILLLIYSRLASLLPAILVLALVGWMFGMLNAAASPLFLAVAPQEVLGRVMSVFVPLQQVANVLSIAAAGFLAGTVLRGMRLELAGIVFGPIDTIFCISSILIIVGGLAVIKPLSHVPLDSPDP